MDNSADPIVRTETRHSLTKWVDEMHDVLRTVTALMEDNDRLQSVAESAQREQGELREELGRLRAEAQQQRGLAESAQREVEHLRAEVATLQSESDRLKTEQVEAGESAAKLLGEMKDLVNQVAHKFQGPSKSSPFAREPRAPQS
jgi:predicted RNase H-like nuclease (RuvC/YqgF family)